MKTFATLYIFFFYIPLLIAQSSAEKIIKGQIISDSNPIEGVNVTNSLSKVMVVSDSYGNFSMLVREGDILSFSSIGYEPLRKFITKQDFAFGSIIVNIVALSVELKEVVINAHPDITAENMGIIPRDQIKLTPAERKLYTAQSGPDQILNYFSGRTTMLKKALSIENKETLMYKLNYLFDDKYYIETLKIPEERIKSFQYYCVENVAFVEALNAKNKTMCMFLITALASDFNKISISDPQNKGL